MDKVAFSLFTGDIVSNVNNIEMSEELVQFEEQMVFDAFKAEMIDSHGGIVRQPPTFQRPCGNIIVFFNFLVNKHAARIRLAWQS